MTRKSKGNLRVARDIELVQCPAIPASELSQNAGCFGTFGGKNTGFDARLIDHEAEDMRVRYLEGVNEG